MSLITVVRSGLRKLGVDIRHYDPTMRLSSLNASFQKFEIDLVLDVGANQGQFASEIRRGGYTGKIVSFEPLSDAHSKLLPASAKDAAWDVYARCALGDHSGEIEINIAGNSLSSSILPMLSAHQTAAPESAYQGRELVSVKTLDSVATPYMKSASAPFLKIDTQGYESKVLDGAGITLPFVRGVLVELSLVPLYKGQPLWMEMIERLEAAGFVLWCFSPVFSDPRDGRTLQVDGVFYRA
jgi:FkbM family methyltransferase